MGLRDASASKKNVRKKFHSKNYPDGLREYKCDYHNYLEVLE